MEKQPFDRPGDYAGDYVFVGPPFILPRIVNAQCRELRRISQPVNMLRRFARSARIGADLRIEDKHADVGVHQIPFAKMIPREIHDADAVCLADGGERAFPNAYPTRMRHKSKLRAFGPQPLVLFLDGQRAHGAQSPKGLLRGIARAAVGTAAEPSAGMLPLRGT